VQTRIGVIFFSASRFTRGLVVKPENGRFPAQSKIRAEESASRLIQKQIPFHAWPRESDSA